MDKISDNTSGDRPIAVCEHGHLRRHCELCDALSRIAALEAELQAARKDAKRYRLLRREDCPLHIRNVSMEQRLHTTNLDYVIDIALSRKEPT